MSTLLRPILNFSLNWLLVTELPATQKSVKYLQKAITALSISSNSNLYNLGFFHTDGKGAFSRKDKSLPSLISKG